MESIFEQLPQILEAVKDSPLAVIALLFVLLAVLASIFFRESKDLQKLSVFTGLLFFAIFIVITVGQFQEEPAVVEDENTNIDDSPPQVSYSASVLAQPVTAINSYLALSLFNPQEPFVPPPLAKALSLEGTPAVFRKSPVFKSIQSFIVDTGNETRANNIQSFSEDEAGAIAYDYSLNSSGETITNYAYNTEDGQPQVLAQGKEEFEENSAVRDNNKVEYVELLNEFRTSIEDSHWTVLNEINPDQTFQFGGFTQFPKLMDVINSSLTENDFVTVGQRGYGPFGSDEWFSRVAEANPQRRGFVGFNYGFYTGLDSDSEISWFEGCGGDLQVIWPFYLAPYVKFMDIVNISDAPVKVNSISYQIVGEGWDPYTLTEVSQRSALFQSTSSRTDTVNYLLPPKQHYFVPVEFGFVPDPADVNQYRSEKDASFFIQNSVFFPQPLNDRQKETGEFPFPASEVTREVKLSEEFVENMKSSIQELSIKKVAIGSIINLTTLEINGENIPLDSPADEVSSAVSEYIGFGSCPYLQVFDENKHQWIDLGPVLYARDEKSKQTTESYKFDSSIKTIRIVERERETTYLDLVQIQPEGDDLKPIKSLVPDYQYVDQIDGKYLALSRGQSVDIDLEPIWQAGTESIVFKVSGYYERD